MNTCAIQTQLRHGTTSLAPVVPGVAMDLPMQCFTAAQQVLAGQQLVLKVSGRSQHHASFLSDPRVTVLTGPDATRYALPTWDAQVKPDVPLRDGSAVADGPRTTPAEPASGGLVDVPSSLRSLVVP